MVAGAGDLVRRRAGVLATLVALPAALLAGLGAFWLSGGFTADDGGPRGKATSTVTVPPLPPPQASGSPDAATLCRALLSALPAELDGHPRRPTTGDPERVAAWGDPPIVLRCDTGERVEPTGTAQVLTVNGVEWTYDEAGGTVVWRSVGRAVTVEVTVPEAHGDESAQTIVNPLSGPVAAKIPRRS